jgi:AcrR family transcriptional regulator
VASGQETRLRADARRNRDRIVAAAKTCFATDGPEVPVEEIARAAGVAPGTLYRHFADRPTLIHAVLLDNFANALAEARAAVAEEPTPWDALARILRQSYEMKLSIQLAMAYPNVRTISKNDPKTDELRRAMIEVIDGVLRRGQTDGSLRTDIGTGDISVMFMMLARPTHIEKKETAQLASERCMALLLESLRPPSSGAKLPGRPLTAADIDVDPPADCSVTGTHREW